jgi:hypothetical protein
LAPGIGFPSASVTVPRTDDVVSCAATGAAVMAVVAARLTTLAARRYLIFMERPLKKLKTGAPVSDALALKFVALRQSDSFVTI